VIDLREPPASDGSLLVRTLLIGMCGTDREIAEDGYGTPPPGEERLVLGHESLAEVSSHPIAATSPRATSSRASSGGPTSPVRRLRGR
jgi:D-arabinose 1-dehydrogenase-like Zn-dependent alcohol dehydrogenase